MKNLFFALLFIPLISFGQIVIYDTYKTVENVNVDTSWNATTTVISDTLNIAEIQDEFIQIQLGYRFHLLSTSEHKNVKMWRTRNQKKWNVFDGDKLISLTDEIDILNFFDKYGFEYFNQNTTSSKSSSIYVPPTNYSSTSITTSGGGSNLTFNGGTTSISTSGGGSNLTFNSGTTSPTFPIIKSSSKTVLTFKKRE